MKNTAITAHSGCEGTLRDALESIDIGIKLGAECVEVDVRMDDAGVLRLSHDKRADYQDAVALSEAFARAADAHIGINCDLKEAKAIYPVLALAEKYGLTGGQLIFSGSVSCDLLAADPEIVRKARVFLNIEELAKHFFLSDSEDFAASLRNPWSGLRERLAPYLDENVPRIASAAKSLGVTVINMPYRGLPVDTLKRLRDLGIELSLWTVNDEDDLRRLFREDLLNITTLNVQTALRVREEL